MVIKISYLMKIDGIASIIKIKLKNENEKFSCNYKELKNYSLSSD